MKNDWNETAETLATLYLEYAEYSTEFNNCVNAILKGMDLVFEATKKECTHKSEAKFQFFTKENVKESILNINKPNL